MAIVFAIGLNAPVTLSEKLRYFYEGGGD
jgi:hypothetical protein